MAQHGVHPDLTSHGSAEDEYLETPPGAAYEHTDAHVWTIVKFAFWLLVSAVVIHVGLGFTYKVMIEQAKDPGEPQYPVAAAGAVQLPPAPRLQQFPRNEVYQFRTGEEAEIHGYGWLDKNAGIVHIPIEDAMRLTLEHGLPSRVQDPSQPAETPGMLASDSSSGRVMERRRQ